MLETLHISNYALINAIDIAFCEGLNVITGETGAGKSIILGALSLILGGRSDSRVVSDPASKSVVEAVFTVDGYADLKEFCDANDIDWDADRLIMRREISPNGRSRAFINDTPVPVSRLREVAIHLVDIHSQHQNLLLAQPDFQLGIIDHLAANRQLLDEYRSRYMVLRECVKKLKSFRNAVAKSREDEEFIRFQLNAIESLNLTPGEDEELERERALQSNISEVKENMLRALNALSRSDMSAIGLVGEAIDACGNLDTVIPSDADIMARLESVRIELSDIADTLESVDSSIETGSIPLDEIDARLAEIHDMERRHNVDSVDALLEIKDNLDKRLGILDGCDDRLHALEKSARRALMLAKESAAALTASRKEMAEKLSHELRERAIPLGMKNLQCEIRVNEADLSLSGADTVEFLFAFNKNQPLLPLGDTASGGEISRLMLSVKAIIAEHVKLPSLILDEIDTGVSGDVANRMGSMMLAISEYSQVITITHLPQVAAKGKRHFKVFKEDDEQATHTSIVCLSPDERVSELALMLSGDSANEAAIANARQLLG